MATDVRLHEEYVYFPSFVTYGAKPTYTVAKTVQSERSRNWSRSFKNRKELLQSLLANGFLPTLPYTDNLQDVVRSKMITLTGQLYADPASVFSWALIPSTARYPVNVATDSDVARSKAAVLAQLQSRISGSGTNLLVSAAEARSTVGMIGDAVMKLADAYKHVKGKRFLDAARKLGLASVPRGVKKNASPMNNWLEYRYGWRLVVLDVSSLMKTLYDSLTLRPPLLRVTAVSKGISKSDTSQGTQSLTMPNGTVAGNYELRRLIEWSWEVRGGYVYKLESVPLANAQSFGLLNAFTFAWEIIPYSFVIDWLLNVGSVLEGITAFQGKTCLDGWICKSLESQTTYFWSNLRKTSSVVSLKCDQISLAFGPAKERRFTRERVTFTPTSLRIDLDLNVPRVIDAIGLISQRLK